MDLTAWLKGCASGNVDVSHSCLYWATTAGEPLAPLALHDLIELRHESDAAASNTAARAAEGFESCPTKCIFGGMNVAIRTTRAAVLAERASADSLRSWPTTSEGAPSSVAPAVCSASHRSCRR